MSDFFGDAPTTETPRPQLVVPLLDANPLEGSLRARLLEELEVVAPPTIFCDENGNYNSDEYQARYGEALTLREASTLRDIVYEQVGEKYRRQLIIARESDGTLDDYRLRCFVEQIDPLI